MTMEQFIAKLKEHDACRPALNWLNRQRRNGKSVQWAWTHCRNGNWLEWWLEESRSYAVANYRRDIGVLQDAFRADTAVYRLRLEDTRNTAIQVYDRAPKRTKAETAQARKNYVARVNRAGARFNKACAPALRKFNEAKRSLVLEVMPEVT